MLITFFLSPVKFAKTRYNSCILRRRYVENGKSYEKSLPKRHSVGPYRFMLRLAVDLNAMAGARVQEVSRKQKAPRSWFRKFSFKYMSNCQCHKSRSRSSEVTVGVIPLSPAPSCQIWSLSVTSRRRSGNGNVATLKVLTRTLFFARIARQVRI